jgi:predicted branched-subunit amino acid permease
MDQPASSETDSAQYWRGLARGASVAVAMIPFGLLFGALAVQNGLSVGEATLASATIFAGASQMVGVELFGQSVPPWLIVLSIFAVNFRHVLYSAAFGRHVRHWTPAHRWIAFFFLTDPQFAESEARHERGLPLTFPWYMGVATAFYLMWVGTGVLGAWFGGLIPDSRAFGLDFLLAIYFLALVMGFRKRPLWLPIVLASGAASMLAFHFVGSPWHVSLGALAGIVLAVTVKPAASEAGR